MPVNRKLYEECAAVLMDKAGLDFSAPWQGDLDDVEHARYEALDALIQHVFIAAEKATDDWRGTLDRITQR